MATEKLSILAGEFSQLYLQLAAAKANCSAIQKKFDHYKLEVIPDALAEEEITSCNIEGIGRLGLTIDAWVGMHNRDIGHQWLRDNGFGDLITETVNHGTLKSWLKEQAKSGHVPPLDIFKFEPYSRASITKR